MCEYAMRKHSLQHRASTSAAQPHFRVSAAVGGSRDGARGGSPGETTSSADLGDSSKYSNENFED